MIARTKCRLLNSWSDKVFFNKKRPDILAIFASYGLHVLDTLGLKPGLKLGRQMVDQYKYAVSWSDEDKQYVGTCAEFPSVSFLASHRSNAFSGIQELICLIVEDMLIADETVPEPSRCYLVDDDWQPMGTARRNGDHILLYTTDHGQVEAWFDPGRWSSETPDHPAEYEGAVWVCGDDAYRIEVEEFPIEAGMGRYHDGTAVAWRYLYPKPEWVD